MVAHALCVRAVSLCPPPVVARLDCQKGYLVALPPGCGRLPTCLVPAGLAAGQAAGVFHASALQMKLLPLVA
jgi:hypothetical protein